MKKMLTQNIYKVDGKRVRRAGLLLAVRNGKVVKFGWSRVNFSAGDTFNPTEGTLTAFNRAFGIIDNSYIPSAYRNRMRQFMKRSAKYFRFCKVYTKANLKPLKHSISTVKG